MYGKLIGIDCSGSELKICVVHAGIRGSKVVDTLCVKPYSDTHIIGATSTTQKAQIIADAIKDKIEHRGDICLNVPFSPFSVRVIKFPFSDPKKVEKVYRFELENVSTFDPEETVHSYHLVETENGSEIIVGVFDREKIRAFLLELKKFGVDPRYLTFSPLAFNSLNGQLPKERPIVLIDTSGEEMSFSLFDERGLRRVRYSTSIGKYISYLAERMPQHEVAVDNDGVSSFISEIRRTVHFFESEIKKEVRSFILSGDICDIENIESFFGEILEANVQKINIGEIEKNEASQFARAFALANYPIKGGPHPFNLRVGEFEFEGGTYELKRNFLVPSILFLVFISLLFYQRISYYYSLSNQVKELRREIQQEIVSVFPKATNVPDPVGFLESELKKIDQRLQLIEEVKGDHTPLDVLRKLSLSIPENIKFSVDEIRFEDGKKIKIWGRCDSYKEIASLEEVLSESGRFKEVNREQVSRAPNNTIKFVLSLVVL